MAVSEITQHSVIAFQGFYLSNDFPAKQDAVIYQLKNRLSAKRENKIELFLGMLGHADLKPRSRAWNLRLQATDIQGYQQDICFRYLVRVGQRGQLAVRI